MFLQYFRLEFLVLQLFLWVPQPLRWKLLFSRLVSLLALRLFLLGYSLLLSVSNGAPVVPSVSTRYVSDRLVARPPLVGPS